VPALAAEGSPGRARAGFAGCIAGTMQKTWIGRPGRHKIRVVASLMDGGN